MEPAYVFLTHTELPHTGNMSAIAKAWPNIEFVVSSGILPHVELPWWVKPESVQYGYPGTDEVFAGRRISFLDAMLKDQPGTHWMYDHQTETLFTADAFGYLFPMSADQQLDDDLEDGIPADWLRRYHEAAFRFLKLSSGDHVIADFDRVFSSVTLSYSPNARQCHQRRCRPMPQTVQRCHAGAMPMNTRVYGEGPSRVGVRQITPKIYWICHCVGKDAEHYNGGFATEFAKVNAALDPMANDIIYTRTFSLMKRRF